MRAGGFESKTGLQPPAGEMTEAVRVWLLGGFRVSIGSRTIEKGAWRLRKAASLVKLLALAPSHRLYREQIMDLLWPDSSRKAASNNLRWLVAGRTATVLHRPGLAAPQQRAAAIRSNLFPEILNLSTF
jgi:hypothetical protein